MSYPNLGFGQQQSASSYPESGGYPPNPGYPSIPAYPSIAEYPVTPVYPLAPLSTPGYPSTPSSIPGYPPTPSSTPGYPLTSSSIPGYSSAPSSTSGYPSAPSAPGYPPTPAGYPSYPPQPTSTGYPSYPPQPASTGYPSYPPQPSNTYPPIPGYPAATPGYPPASNPGYPPVPASGYPSSAPGYAVAKNVSHPSQSYSADPVEAQVLPTLRHLGNFDPSVDAAMLRKAMKGFGTDEQSIINVLGNRTNDQRQRIILSYQQAYGKKLVKDLHSELSGDFLKLLDVMMTPTHEFLADQLYGATKGFGTNENTLVEILCTRNNAEINAIKLTYQSKYGRPLQKDIEGDTSGHFKRLMVSMCAASRDEHNTSVQMAPQLAQELFRAGEGRTGTDESTFNRILACHSYPLTRATFQEYKKIKGRSLHDAIKSEFSGDIKDGLLAVVMSIENRPQFFAMRIHTAMKGMGTNDDSLIRLIVTRSEVDLETIKQLYKRMHGRTMEQDIKDDTSGDYRKLLLTLVKA